MPALVSGWRFWLAPVFWGNGRLAAADKLGRLLVLRVGVCGDRRKYCYAESGGDGPALFMLGAAGFTLYPVAMARACEKVEHHQLVAMNQALLLSYTVGSLLGPSFTAMLMQNYSDSLLFIMIASVSFIYLLMLLRKTGHTPNSIAHI